MEEKWLKKKRARHTLLISFREICSSTSACHSATPCYCHCIRYASQVHICIIPGIIYILPMCSSSSLVCGL